ncbi:FdtA/QdtA family cupin domain-containing protein [Campylobacter sp. RM12327]|uniref:sugar 3,4-ketoisomerase n=1 Tax=Campylobacter sputorum TaxID=206 RepID=UPI000B779F59|nr:MULTISPECIES: FdtA/QdtA family cupin domain-containing protein [Campylobacter]ASM40530.1 dTDP-6-deoxy-3,4-keto-hexulose isomerase [Campylobacter sputorum]MBE7357805.1 FdtA/QdtA family cupin domain-containing protein [Campylobacter sp. RM11302]MBF6669083.1 FdtA/QdtA family cupin domain-containing protein [Campylobacter sp. RM12327]MBF6673908.1 FdtA/QdtA family cupin domain-containing protein [Campylobacter sp. RM13538]MBF6675823.1 FdtA/QdtA family cupin domain-containing protein [Campylobact
MNSSSYRIIDFNTFGDERGSLIALEGVYDIPFDIKRVYYIFDTKEGVERGFHAHINLKQICIAVKGSCVFVLDNGKTREEIKLDNPNKGLFIEGLIWREMKDFSSDCVLVVIASEHYYESDYIRDYDNFLEITKKSK